MSDIGKGRLSELRRKSLRLGGARTDAATTTRFVEFDFENSSAENADTGIAFVSWRTYRVTPLLHFSYDKEKLNLYSKRLNAYIEKELKKNCGVIVSQETTYRTKFSVLRGIATSRDDNEAIKIEIFEKKQEPVAVIILASVEREQEAWERNWNNGQFVFLPVLLSRGINKIANWIFGYLKDDFECIVHPLVFTHVQMMWMGAMWAGCKQNDSLKPLLLEYHTGIEELSHVEYTVDPETVSQLWDRIHNPRSNVMTEDEVNSFNLCVEDNFRKAFCIDLSYFHLQTVGTNAALVRKTGFIKIFRNEFVWFVLRHLTELAQELALT